MILVIPFRDRGIDPYRAQNLAFVTRWWETHGLPVLILDDGRSGQETFNRSACYNRAVKDNPHDVFVFTEADVFCHPEQITQGVDMARQHPGLVVGFSRFLEINEQDSITVRAGADHTTTETVQAKPDCESNGAINIITRDTYNRVGGYDETFSSAWYDDRAMGRAFDICCGPARYVTGPAWHLFHASGGRAGAVTTQADREATAANKARWKLYQQAQTPEQIRQLTT